MHREIYFDEPELRPSGKTYTITDKTGVPLVERVVDVLGRMKIQGTNGDPSGDGGFRLFGSQMPYWDIDCNLFR